MGFGLSTEYPKYKWSNLIEPPLSTIPKMAPLYPTRPKIARKTTPYTTKKPIHQPFSTTRTRGGPE